MNRALMMRWCYRGPVSFVAVRMSIKTIEAYTETKSNPNVDKLGLGSVLHLSPDLVSKLAILPVLPVARPVQ